MKFLQASFIAVFMAIAIISVHAAPEPEPQHAGSWGNVHSHVGGGQSGVQAAPEPEPQHASSWGSVGSHVGGSQSGGNIGGVGGVISQEIGTSTGTAMGPIVGSNMHG
ncbi:tenecin-3-like [Stomoxys calcitrans]|uniref:tenecin-3-like n=1 Tax=Stomoxys calcitrans TaxID=35570 RepID=UPI0027E36BA3|nr:tenecin-3-like [Stomoxys calcitrans]